MSPIVGSMERMWVRDPQARRRTLDRPAEDLMSRECAESVSKVERIEGKGVTVLSESRYPELM